MAQWRWSLASKHLKNRTVGTATTRPTAVHFSAPHAKRFSQSTQVATATTLKYLKPKSFDLEPRSIEQTYWNLQKRLHPDLYGSKSEVEKKLSAVNSAVINDAYKILKEPNTRINYLLTLHGVDALGETASTAVDSELLMQTMEIRERIAEAADVDALEKIRKEISKHIDAIINKLGKVYDRDQDLESTERYAVELQYMVKCAEETETREEELDGY
ncbi:hypothetical protein CCR75_002330 [Bremia lactucae]|uniref:J domain-containing protein n=1 Tax=Bremia lactucae TaxID=4779 RepID=A0A976NYX6_BRELC|nr:hypothetical protein CCR75_002330 [Bremia lactucae]